MGFFQGAYDFEVNGGTFYDITGDQINRTHDASVKVGGRQNKLNVQPDVSRQDNRTYNAQEEQVYTAYNGPSQGSASTYPGYGQMPHGVASMPPHGQSIPNPQVLDPQAVVHYQQWMEYLQYQQWILYMQQRQQAPPPQTTNQQPAQQYPEQPTEQFTSRDQPFQQGEQNTQTTCDEQAPATESGPIEDEDVSGIRLKLENQHINDSHKSR